MVCPIVLFTIVLLPLSVPFVDRANRLTVIVVTTAERSWPSCVDSDAVYVHEFNAVCAVDRFRLCRYDIFFCSAPAKCTRDKRQCLHSYISQCSLIGREMAECPPFQSMLDVAPVCQSPPPPPPPPPSSSPPPSPSSSPPPPPSVADIVFPMPGQPIFGPLPLPFGYPPMAWSPFLYPPPLPLQPPSIYDRHAEDVDVGYSGGDVSQLIVHQQQSAEYVNYDSAGDFFNEPFRPSFQHRPPPKYRPICHPRNTSNKVYIHTHTHTCTRT